MTDVTLRDRAERRALGILTFFAATMLATGAIQLVLVLTEKGFDDLRFVWDLMQIVWRAAIIGLAAGAAAWGRATRSPLGLVATVGIAFIALAPVLSFVGEIFELGRDLRVIFDVSRLAYGVGYAALAVGVATKVQGATRGAASVLAGIVAVAGLLAVGVGVFPKVFGGDLVEIFGQYGPLIRDALLLALLIVARSAVRDVAPGPFYASVEEQSALKEALSGTNLYRNGLTVKVFAVFAGILLGILAAGARSAGFGVIVLVLVGGATFVGELMMFIGLARYRRQPLGTGGSVDATTGFVAAVFSVIMGLAAIVGLILALILNTKGLALKPVYRVLLILPWAMPNYITALIWQGMFHQQFGVVNQVVQMLGMEPVSWFETPATSFFTAWATNGWLSFPFMMVISLGALQSIPVDLYEAARVDGASRWQQFTAITLPSLKPALVPAIILSVVWTFNMFNIIFLVTAGQPAGSTEILITQSYKFAFEKYQYGYAAAYSTVIFAILLIYGVFQNRVTRATEGV